ncbi:MAG: alpha/beta hydrolase [Micrococcales bacterium]|nr:alpha/beta hydrolase [Micrococcales bacterium]MCL2668950.1 alpha/beta hydrolase [Micrococcales bacterium]
MGFSLSRPGGQIAVYDDGPADGPVVVLVSGMGDLASAWDDVVGPLVGAGYRVVRPELRGHGGSGTSFAEHGVEATAGDIAALLDHLERTAVVVGCSFAAASVAWAAAERPEAVEAVVLVAPEENAEPKPKGARMVSALLRPGWGPPAWAWFYRQLAKGRRPARFDEHLAALRADLRRPGHLASLRALALSLVAGTGRHVFDEITAPTLVVVGDRDPEIGEPRAVVDGFVARLPDAQGLVVDECGHFPALQRPDVLVEALQGFLSQTAHA